jgi:hypothetical protein
MSRAHLWAPSGAERHAWQPDTPMALGRARLIAAGDSGAREVRGAEDSIDRAARLTRRPDRGTSER